MNQSTRIVWLLVAAAVGSVHAQGRRGGAESGSTADCRGRRMPLASGGRLESRERNRACRFDDVIHDARSGQGRSGETARQSAISAARHQPVQSRAPQRAQDGGQRYFDQERQRQPHQRHVISDAGRDMREIAVSAGVFVVAMLMAAPVPTILAQGPPPESRAAAGREAPGAGAW